MRIDIITLFPEMCEALMNESIVGRARKRGYLQMCFHQLRNYAHDKHKRVDDLPFGGGKGMLLKPEPIAEALDTLTEHLGEKPYMIYMSPRGNVLNQAKVRELATKKNICILCGHYEGVDERILDEYIDEELSCGDYVLTGGEMPAMIVADAVSRMIPGVLAEDTCFTEESHYNGLLEYPQYTRPAEFHGRKVPEVLTSGDHAKVEDWKHKKSLEVTLRHRPDMLEYAELTDKDRKYIEELKADNQLI
ncbi:MAG: tRNA (guanosine(37)-N1)-methyltransferase TrmD [Clostridia bacterium]|nr:tRNA (guanosine(37)-N1)-methyltransferase TrmD [Clostridia bacterium]